MAVIDNLESLKDLAFNGDPRALDHISQMASFGGNDRAKVIIREIEEKGVVFKDEEESPKISKRSDLRQVILHPINSLQTKARQILVSIDGAQAPIGSNHEDFPNLGIAEASKLLRQNKKNK